MTEQNLPELLPCPFCGGVPSIQVGYHMIVDAKVACTDCTAEGPLFGSDAKTGDYRIQAISAWNARAAIEQSRVWLPIESAPKDGLVIDLWADGRRWPDMYFGDHQWFNGNPVGERRWGQAYGNEHPRSEPTHWMPLPAAPAQDAPRRPEPQGDTPNG